MSKHWRIVVAVIAFGGLLSCEPERFVPNYPKAIVIRDIQLSEFPSVELTMIKGTENELNQIRAGVLLLNAVYASQCFEREVLTREFTETNEMNNQEIYNLLRSGTIFVSVIMYTGSWAENNLWRTVGYVRANIPDTVFQNRHFVTNEAEIARNLIHEIAHLRGFNHYQVFATSVPYQMNDIWDICAGELGIN